MLEKHPEEDEATEQEVDSDWEGEKSPLGKDAHLALSPYQ